MSFDNMFETETQLLQFLEVHQIPYQRLEHPPVYTCEEAERLRPKSQGVSTKNLFLRDKRGVYYLVMTDCEKRVDLKKLEKQLGAPKLHFGSEEKLRELLGLTRGAVTVLGLVNDVEHHVHLLVDADIWNDETFLCHPLVNTATLVLIKADLERFFALTGHVPRVEAIPT
jgi:Ala-tRNA(Pro) deacylase